ncbi:GNAT family N-acetyltransferase [Leptospira sp. WS58.C1]|uniref:GNAT family N-acetyltransferase n=1 Tax=Leptospira TaxID=171 RepID=UPI0002BF33B4|nr:MULTISPECIES: GNAT family N-acetyltransferase [unclassified Leptospira]EMJ97888.1 acetyltransferase, GNAT domain protein [Leptospira sp. B5-022]MCR1794644.1 N-acetyltransferase [Leptospira sp. id769339]
MNSVQHDVAGKKFLILQDGREAHLVYREIGSHVWDLYHTFVPTDFRGKGIASQLAEAALKTARAETKKVIPNCSFVQTYLKRHPEYSDLVIME